MGSRGGGGGTNGGGVQGIPAASRKMVQSLKEIVNGVSEAEIYSALKDCNMDPNEAVNRLLSQDPFHEVKSKREKKKEFKDTTESRPRGGGSTSTRGARSDRYTGRSGSTQFNSSESGGLHGKPRRENGTSSYTSSSTPSYGVAATNTNRAPPTYSGTTGYENKPSTYSLPDGPTSVPHQQTSGYQSAWLNTPGQKSMADIVKMGRPQTKPTVPHQQSYEDYTSKAPENNSISPDNDWPSIEPPQFSQTKTQTVGVQLTEPQIAPQSDLQQHERNDQIDEEEEEDDEGEGVYEDHHVEEEDEEEDHVESFHHDENEGEEGDVSASSVSANMQQLNIQEDRHVDEVKDENAPAVVIPNHLQVQTADCSHLSFGSFGASLNTGFSGSFMRNKVEETPVEPDHTPSVGPSENRNSEYYGEESIMASESNRAGPTSGNYDLPSASQTEVLKQENADVAHGNQYGYSSSTPGQGYTFDSTQLLNPSFPQSQTPTQTPFSNVVQAAYTNSLPNTLLAANGHPVGESDLSYSPFPITQQMPTKYGNSSVSSISNSTISMAEALKTGVFSSSSQPTQQTPIPTGPALPQHLTVHPYSQPTLPLGPFANMIGYPFLPQSYTYMPSGFQQAFAGNSTYHQQLAAVLPQYKNSVSVSSLPQSAAAVPSGYGSFGGSTAVPGNYQVNQAAVGPAGSTLSYDDVLNAHYKENSQLLSLQQNDNSGMWVHGAGSRTMSAVPASTYYSFQGQNQQPTGFRQAQQQQPPSQTYGGAALNYPNYYHSQAAISPDHQHQHQLQQNPRDGSLVGGGGSQGQPKPQQQQSQQLWQNSY